MVAIFLDATTFLHSSRKTGIQRVVSDLVDAESGDTVTLVQFSSDLNQFVEVPEIPTFEAVGSSPLLTRLTSELERALTWLWGSTTPLRARLNFFERGLPLVRGLWSAFFRRYSLSPANRVVDPVIVQPSSVLLMSVPQDSRHIDFLASQIDAGLRVIVYLYDLIPTKTDEIWSADLNHDQKYLFDRFMNRVVVRAHSVVCLSHFTRSEYTRYRASGRDASQKISVAYPPARLGFLEGRGVRSDLAAARTGGSDPISLDVMVVAPLLRRKNLRVVFSALEQIVSSGSAAVTLRVVCPASGAIDYEAWRSLRRLQRDSSVRVHFMRDVTDEELNCHYSLTQIVAVPSLYEGFGLPVIEASAAGACLLASDIPVFRELNASIKMKLVDPHSVKAWEKALVSLNGRNCSPQLSNHVLPSPRDFLDSVRSTVD